MSDAGRRRSIGRRWVLSCGLAATITGCQKPTEPMPVAAPPTASKSTASKPAASKDNAPVPQPTREQLIAAIGAAQQQGDMDSAEKLLRQLLIDDPNDFEAIFALAQLLQATGHGQRAIELLKEIPIDTPDIGVAALGVAAQWCVDLGRYDEAKKRYQKILQADPSLNQARRPLAYLNNRQGRRHAAVALVRQLCRSGDVMQDELHSLIVEADAMYDAPGAASSTLSRPYFPISPLADARLDFTEHRYAAAAAKLQPIVASGRADGAISALYGRALAEAQDDEAMGRWLATVGPEHYQFPDFWAAVGAKLMRETRYEAGLTALAKALLEDPTDVRSTRRMVQGFRALKKPELEAFWQRRYEQISRSVVLSGQVAAGDRDAIGPLVEVLESLDRNLEAILWQAIMVSSSETNSEASMRSSMAELNGQRIDVVQNGDDFPSPEKILGSWSPPVDVEQAVAQMIAPTNTSPSDSIKALSPESVRDFVSPRFEDVTSDSGLSHRYQIATEPPDRGFAIYQQNGGGIAVIDYDLDGIDDLYLAQGAADPPDFVATESDQLIRLVDTASGLQCIDQTRDAGVVDSHYTLGVARGDWNQDGFDDLAVANIGPEVLLINQGDGTFEKTMLAASDDLTTLSTSIAMADLSGDQLPDLYVANYLHDSAISQRPERDADGYAAVPKTPHDFQPALDSFGLSDGSGGMTWSNVGQLGVDESYGLGLLVADFDSDSSGNEVFVSNDARANQCWSYGTAGNRWQDFAVAIGCAFGSSGAATASMGIAAGDFDRSGSMDLCVTNFQNESSSLYLRRDGLYRDFSIRFGLDRVSTSVLGFGTQSIDYDNNRTADLVVANGHVEDLTPLGQPFRQPLQFLVNRGNEFAVAETAATDGVLGKDGLGRSLVTADFDRDGRTDVVVTDLLDSTSLLLNRTDTPHHWIGLRLIGTQSERNAIGAHVAIESGNGTTDYWVTAGDGYLGSNGSCLRIGLGLTSEVDAITVDWPSGDRERFAAVPVDRYVMLLEGQSVAHAE